MTKNNFVKSKIIKAIHPQKHDPWNPVAFPRPAVNAKNVPIRTSFYFTLLPDSPSEPPLPETISVSLETEDESLDLIRPGKIFAKGYNGFINELNNVTNTGEPTGEVEVYIDTHQSLKPDTLYTIKVTAFSKGGAHVPPEYGEWSFKTESAQAEHIVDYKLSFESPTINWEGGILGLVHSSFNTSYWCRPILDLIKEARKTYPKAWSLQRDFYMTADNYRLKGISLQIYPNIVKEQETKRVLSISPETKGYSLSVTDFYGCQQYGIEPNRPLDEDYCIGDKVLISDGKSSATAVITSVDSKENKLFISDYTEPEAGWDFTYSEVNEMNGLPGAFPSGGVQVSKLDPPGTPKYYWGRLDHQFDMVADEYGLRAFPNFCDAPGDLAVTGNNGSEPKDLFVLRKVFYDITDHLIKRYGDKTLTWYWCILNEPNFPYAWSSGNWPAVQKFYDYTADAIYRAFEDNGYSDEQIDSLLVGGLELGGAFGLTEKFFELIMHCSPKASADPDLASKHPDVYPRNAVFEDPRLDGLRSRYVQKLCEATGGHGSPLKFASVHCYKYSDVGADMVRETKARALEMDPEYFEKLIVNAHEAAPCWTGLSDIGAAEMYLGNGYFSSWGADFISRMVHQAAKDQRYSYGGWMLITTSIVPPRNFHPANNVAREIRLKDGTIVAAPMQIFNIGNLTSTLGPIYWPLPDQNIGGHIVSGIASPTDEGVRIMLYSHHRNDTQTRSIKNFKVNLELKDMPWSEFTVVEYQIDKVNNSYYNYAMEHRTQNEFSIEEYNEILELTSLKVTKTSKYSAGNNGSKSITVDVAGNGVNFLVIEPV